MFSARYRESHGTIERRQISSVESARLTFLQPKSYDAADTGFDVIVDRHAVTIKKD